MPAGVPIGALVLVRDITEVRRRDRALITKDATIREIHHRVKNNLQTVAALLRLQARRVSMPEARIALEESVRRVASIALVHETLSMSSDEAVEFDGIVDRVASAATEVAATEQTVGMRRRGSFGVLPAEIATSLVMVLNELLLNAVEHGFPPAAEAPAPVPSRWPGPRRRPGPLRRLRRRRSGPRRRAGPRGLRRTASCRSSRSPARWPRRWWSSRRTGSASNCTSPSPTTGAACRPSSTPSAAAGSASRSSGRW